MEKKYTLKEMHEVFLSMMEEFHDFCVSHNLTYYMVGGTLLGAIREKGFIPWDDDVDFAMPREDYERFIRIYEGNLQVISYLTDEECFFPYAKLVHKELSVIEISDSEYMAEGQVFGCFDVYPIDGVGNTQKEADALIKKVNFWKHITYLNTSTEVSPNWLKALGTKLLRKVSTHKMVRHTDKIMQKYAYSESSLVTRWRMPMQKNVVNKTVFGKPTLVDFETLQFYAPEQADVYLTKVYGDYRVSKREDVNLRHSVDANDIVMKFAAKMKRKKSDEKFC